MLTVEVVSTRLIGGSERCAEPVGEFGQVAIGDESVPERQLLLVGKWQERRLPNGAGLDPSRDGEIRPEGRSPGRRFRQQGDGCQPFQDRHVGGRLGEALQGHEGAGRNQTKLAHIHHGSLPVVDPSTSPVTFSAFAREVYPRRR